MTYNALFSSHLNYVVAKLYQEIPPKKHENNVHITMESNYKYWQI